MKIKINGKEIEVASDVSIIGLLDHLEMNHNGRAVAVNNKVIAKSDWSTYILHENDMVTIITAFYGG